MDMIQLCLISVGRIIYSFFPFCKGNRIKSELLSSAAILLFTDSCPIALTTNTQLLLFYSILLFFV